MITETHRRRLGTSLGLLDAEIDSLCELTVLSKLYNERAVNGECHPDGGSKHKNMEAWNKELTVLAGVMDNILKYDWEVVFTGLTPSLHNTLTNTYLEVIG